MGTYFHALPELPRLCLVLDWSLPRPYSLVADELIFMWSSGDSPAPLTGWQAQIGTGSSRNCSLALVLDQLGSVRCDMVGSLVMAGGAVHLSEVWFRPVV
jgi:hypothetical protein